jgi:hypothetical protein
MVVYIIFRSSSSEKRASYCIRCSSRRKRRSKLGCRCRLIGYWDLIRKRRCSRSRERQCWRIGKILPGNNDGGHCDCECEAVIVDCLSSMGKSCDAMKSGKSEDGTTEEGIVVVNGRLQSEDLTFISSCPVGMIQCTLDFWRCCLVYDKKRR